MSEELKSRVIDYLYEIKYNSRGWLREESLKLITELEGEQNESRTSMQ